MLLDSAEVTASLDAFPIELGGMMASYEVVHGRDPFIGLRIDPADLRRACEVQVRSHLLHLREGFLETAGVPAAIGRLVSNSAAPLLLLLANLARLSGESGAGPQQLAAFGARITASPASVFAEVLTSVASWWTRGRWGQALSVLPCRRRRPRAVRRSLEPPVSARSRCITREACTVCADRRCSRRYRVGSRHARADAARQRFRRHHRRHACRDDGSRHSRAPGQDGRHRDCRHDSRATSQRQTFVTTR